MKGCTQKSAICRKKIGSLHPGFLTWWVGKVIIRTWVVPCWISSRCWRTICSMTLKNGIGRKEINTASNLKIEISEANEVFRGRRTNWKKSCVPIWLRIPNVQGVSRFVAISWSIFLILFVFLFTTIKNCVSRGMVVNMVLFSHACTVCCNAISHLHRTPTI